MEGPLTPSLPTTGGLSGRGKIRFEDEDSTAGNQQRLKGSPSKVSLGLRPAMRRSSSTSSPSRKLSTNVLLQEPSLSVYAAAAEKARETHVADATMRKISQVGHAFTSTFGWNSHPSHQDVVLHSRTLCGRYIRAKIRASSEDGKKLGLQRLRSVTNLNAVLGTTSSVRRSYQLAELNMASLYIRKLGLELERSHPKLFTSVINNVGLQKLSNEATVHLILRTVARELFYHEINWGRIVAFFAVTGALATDCVRHGKAEYVLGLIDVFSDIVDHNLSNWIANQGGWEGIQSQFRKSRRFQALRIALNIILPVVFVAVVLWVT